MDGSSGYLLEKDTTSLKMREQQNQEKRINLTILMPCLNEEENIAFCINEAKSYLASVLVRFGHIGEILIVDNNSKDRSAYIAKECGARVVTEAHQGYGCALRTGLRKARGSVIIFGDCDSTYDFGDLDSIYLPLAENRADFVTGNRLGVDESGDPTMEPGAMSLSHKLGVPFLSWCGRAKFRVRITDFHCGIRGIRKDAVRKCRYRTTGMEFATEMIAEAKKRGLRIEEVTVPLRVSKVKRREKLKTVRDGIRHFLYIVKA